MTKFSGIWVPLVTPFKDGDIDYAAAKRLARHLVDKGVHGLVVCGTTGEGASLSQMEKTSFLEAIVDEVAGRCPIIMGLSGSSTRDVIDDALAFAQIKIDGYLLSAPSYVLPDQAGITAHFKEIAQATILPIVIYNVPARTGVNITIETMQELCQSKQFVAVKECFGIKQLMALAENPPCNVLCGADTLMFMALTGGGHGAITASAAVEPELFVAMYHFVQQGHTDLAQELFHHLMRLIGVLFSEPNPAPVKAALSLQGFIQNELRLPLLPASDDCVEQLKMVMEELDSLRPIYMKGMTHAA